MTTDKIRLLLGLALCGMASAASAHVGGGEAAGFSSGLLHPLTGLDHLLALIGVGLWAVWLGRAALVRLPAVFLLALAGGTVLALNGLTVPAIDLGVAASVLSLALLAASRWRPGETVALTIAGVFGLLHGQAHGLELPAGGDAWTYVAGLLLVSGVVMTVSAAAVVRLHQPLRRGLAFLTLTLGAGVLFH